MVVEATGTLWKVVGKQNYVLGYKSQVSAFDSLDSDTTFDLAFINSYENVDMIEKMNEA